MKLRAALGGVLALALAASAPASAQPKSDAAAQAVFQEGLTKFEQGDYAGACPLLERAVELSSTPALGGILTLAECFEKIDRPASAWGLYGKVAAAARAEGQTDRADRAQKAAERLEPTLPKVRFVWRSNAPPPAGLRVKYGSESVPADTWNVALPIDPGAVRFTFEADGRKPATRTADIARGAAVTEIIAPELDAPGPTGAPHLPTVATPAKIAEPAKPPAITGPGATGIVMASNGTIGLAVSIGLIVDAKNKWKRAVDHDCGGHVDSCSTLAGINKARSQGDAASVTFGVSVGFIGGGMALLIYDLARTKKPIPATDPKIGFAIAPDGRGGGAGFASTQWSFE